MGEVEWLRLPTVRVNDMSPAPRDRGLRVGTMALEDDARTDFTRLRALRRAKVPDEAAETVLGRFADVGLIDDAAFARAWVESRHHSRGLSRRSLSAELRRSGVASEDIREAVEGLDPEQEVATARRLVEQKMAATRGHPPEARARRAAGLLARKGYPPGLVFRLIKEFLEQEGEALDLDPDQYLDPDAEATG